MKKNTMQKRCTKSDAWNRAFLLAREYIHILSSSMTIIHPNTDEPGEREI
jgi:hypothetical protein